MPSCEASLRRGQQGVCQWVSLWERAMPAIRPRSGRSGAQVIETAVAGMARSYRIRSAEFLYPLRRTDHIRHPDPELVVDDHDLAVRDQRAVHEHIERFAGEAIELDHRALAELQEI